MRYIMKSARLKNESHYFVPCKYLKRLQDQLKVLARYKIIRLILQPVTFHYIYISIYLYQYLYLSIYIYILFIYIYIIYIYICIYYIYIYIIYKYIYIYRIIHTKFLGTFKNYPSFLIQELYL